LDNVETFQIEPFPVTDSSGKRIYIPIKTNKNHLSQLSPALLKRKPGTLLPIPLTALYVILDTEEVNKRLVASTISTTSTTFQNYGTDRKLWVDKYSPASFAEILSDERTNSDVLRWVKEWDICVFGSTTLKAIPAPKISTFISKKTEY